MVNLKNIISARVLINIGHVAKMIQRFRSIGLKSLIPTLIRNQIIILKWVTWFDKLQRISNLWI
jgi:phage antirepressor YoqD-like protein